MEVPHPIIFGTSPQRNDLLRCSLYAMAGCQLTLIMGSHILYKTNQTKASKKRLLDDTGHFLMMISQPPASLEGEMVFINRKKFQILSRRCVILTGNLWVSNSLKCHDFRVVVTFAFTFPQVAAARINFRECMFQGLVFCYLACWVQFLPVQFQMCQGGSCSHALFRDFRDYLVQRRPALRCITGIWAWGCLKALCKAVVYACGYPPEAWSRPGVR